MSTIVITNFKPRACILPPIEGTGVPEEAAGKCLLPGENTVTEECWKKAIENPAVKIWLRNGELKRTGSGEASRTSHDWDSLTVARAADIIGQIDEIESLIEIKAQSNKKGIIAACDQRIKELHEQAEEDNK